MTLTIELPPEIEVELSAQAGAQGLDLPKYIEHVLRGYIGSRDLGTLSPAERAEAWRRSTHGLPHTPPLSDDAISRDNIYGDRGR